MHKSKKTKEIEFNIIRDTCICFDDAELKQHEPIQQTQHIPIFYLVIFYFN